MQIKNHSLFLTFFITRNYFMIFGYSNLLNIGKRDTLSCAIVGTIIGFLLLYIYKKWVANRKSLASNILVSFFAIFTINITLIILETFSNSFYLVRTPNLVITIPFLVLAFYIANKGFTTIYRVSQCLFPITLILYIITFITLIWYSDFANLEPMFTSTFFNFCKCSIFFAFLTVTPNLFIFELDKANKNISKSYLFSLIPIILTILFAITVLGNELITVYRAPEYMILKRIKIFNFIEKVENLTSVVFVFDMFITTAIATLLLKNNLPKKYNNIYLAVILIICIYISSIVIGKNNVIELFIYRYLPHMLIILFLALFTTKLFSKKVKASSA